MLSWLTSIGGQALQFFFGSSGNISNTDVRDAVQGIWSAIQALASFLQKLLGNELAAWEEVEPQIEDGALGFGELAHNDRAAWERLLNVILPNSLSWLDGHTHQWVDRKYDPIIAALRSRVAELFYLVDGLNRWRATIVDPELGRWRTWHRWFTGWPRSILYLWKHWLAKPSDFGLWAAPAIARPLLSYLSQPNRRILRDQWAAMIVDAAPDIGRHVDNAVLALLLEEV